MEELNNLMSVRDKNLEKESEVV